MLASISSGDDLFYGWYIGLYRLLIKRPLPYEWTLMDTLGKMPVVGPKLPPVVCSRGNMK